MVRMPAAAASNFRGSRATWKQRKISVQGNAARKLKDPAARSRPSAMLTPRSGYVAVPRRDIRPARDGENYTRHDDCGNRGAKLCLTQVRFCCRIEAFVGQW